MWRASTPSRSIWARSALATGGAEARGRQAHACGAREACGDKLIELARPGDRIVIMGARDDTLVQFAAGLVERLGDGQGAAAVAAG